MQISSFIFLLIIWDSSSCPSENRHPNHLQFPLGCPALIPCQHYNVDSFQWFYKKDEHHQAIKIFSQDKNGLDRHERNWRDKITVLSNGSLVIFNLREDDQGLYWCGNCIQPDCRCTFTNVTKEILKDTYDIDYATAGNSFTRACPGELSHFRWTFQASNMTAPRDFMTSNKSIHIVNVKRADAGKYTCWRSRCKGHWQKILTINLCVVTVHGSEDACTVMCDEEFNNTKPNSTSNTETDRKTVHVVPHSILNCSTKPMLNVDRYSVVTHRQSNASVKTTGTPTEPEHPILIYGTSAALAFLVLIALLIYYLRPRLRAVASTPLCCCGLSGRAEEDTSVVYSSIIIRRPAETTYNHMTYNDCVYSEIKV